MRIVRFDRISIILHWSHAIIFSWFLVTGVQLFFTRESLLGDPLKKMIHLYASPFLLLLPVIIYVSANEKVKRDVNELISWTDNDLRWFVDFMKREKTPCEGKFNGGQKANFLITSLLIIGFSFSGYVVWMKSMFSVDFVELNFMLHDFLTILALLLLTGHIVFTLYYIESIRGIISGAVDIKWAEDHYPGWYKKMEENKNR